MIVSSKIDHTNDGVRNCGRNNTHDHKTHKVADNTHGNGIVDLNRTGADRLGNGICRISSTVHKNTAENKDNDNGKKWICHNHVEEASKGNHSVPLQYSCSVLLIINEIDNV